MIHLIGPGGSGKSTTSPLPAALLGVGCIDLDAVYMLQAQKRGSSIGDDIERSGCGMYVRRNVELYCEQAQRSGPDSVMVTSSGFMGYNPGYHPALADVQNTIVGDAHASADALICRGSLCRDDSG